MSKWPLVMCPGCKVPMGVKAVIEDRPGTDSVTVIYECPICKTETQRHQKGVDPTNRTPGLATSAHRVGVLAHFEERRDCVRLYRSARLATESAKPNSTAWIQPVPVSVSI